MYMFPGILENVPKVRSELVNELEIPEISLTPYVWTPEESLRSESSSTCDDWKNRSYSDPWTELQAALDAFPPGYLDSLKSFESSSEGTMDSWSESSRFTEELVEKMERFFEEECRVFTPDDPGLRDLQESLQLFQ
ncbi:unnamed protein product, partial [Leptidea sinapis]